MASVKKPPNSGANEKEDEDDSALPTRKTPEAKTTADAHEKDGSPEKDEHDDEDDDFALPTKKTPEAKTAARAVNKRRTTLIALAPIVSIATLMLGLRVGAGNTVHAATIFAAPFAKPASAGAKVPVTLQVLTYLEDRGVRETVGMRDLTVSALFTSGARTGSDAWTGASNIDGIAEATLSIANLQHGDRLEVTVTQKGESQPLAEGTVDFGRRDQADLMAEPLQATNVIWGRAKGDNGDRAAARPSKREGALQLDVIVEGERLVVGFETPLWIHVNMPTSAMDASRVHLELTPEPGLSTSSASNVDCGGWSETKAIAMAHVVGVQIDAKDPEMHSGVWFGPLPVAPGAFFVGLPHAIAEGKAETAVLVAPNPRNVVYAEVDDEEGRAFAAALTVGVEQGDPTPRAHFDMPPLAPGLHWLVVSGEPRGAERLAGAAIAKPFLVGKVNGVDEDKACSIGPWLARRPAVGFPRWLAIDGMATRGAANRVRHRAGLFIGLFSLFAAALLEVLLLTAASREARAVILLAELDEPEADRPAQITAQSPGGGLLIGLLVAVLGFALLAAMLIAKG